MVVSNFIVVSFLWVFGLLSCQSLERDRKVGQPRVALKALYDVLALRSGCSHTVASAQFVQHLVVLGHNLGLVQDAAGQAMFSID
jgi:hypothetical protein